jgi:hypothetical protein
MFKTSLLALAMLVISFGAESQEPPLATGFVWPLLSDFTVDPRKNTQDTRGLSPTCPVGRWFVNGNDFGNRTCPAKLGCFGTECYHPGEDWNQCPILGINETGESVYAVANGIVVNSDLVQRDGRSGYFLVIKHTLPSDERLADYVYTGTQATGVFSAVYSSYLHIDNLDVAVGDHVEKGQKIAEISSCCGHLHLEMQINGSGIKYCEGCSYCTSRQHLSDSGYIDPTAFISAYSNDVAAVPLDSTLGLIELRGREGSFGAGGNLVAGTCVADRLCIDLTPLVRSWNDERVVFDLYGESFSQHDFVLPVVIRVDRADGKALDVVLYPFKDMEFDAWYSGYTIDLWKRRVLTGRGGAGFLWPEADVTRAELVRMLVAASGESCREGPCTQTPAYQDVDPGEWYFESVVVAYNLGWLSPALLFRPGDSINRAETSEILARALGLAYRQTPVDPFLDVIDEGTWFYESVYAVRKRGLMAGYPEGVPCEASGLVAGSLFCPGRSLSRAEAIKVVAKAFPSGL